MKSNQDDKQQLIERCYNEYEDNADELNKVREFEHEYLPQNALWWYTRQSFVHKMLNKALRTQDIELLFLFRFLIHDIYEQLKRSQCHARITVYRGQVMSDKELKTLQRSVNKMISINSFFSTSVESSKAMKFLNAPNISNDLHPVLFVIEAYPYVNITKPFADISSHSRYNEEEVLFMVGCVFRLIDIRQNGQIWIIYMQLCDDDENDMQDLFQHMKKQYAGADKEVGLRSFAAVLYQMGKYDLAKMVYHRLLNELSSNDPMLSSIYRSLGMIAEEKSEYNTSLEWYQKSLKSQMRINPSNHVDIGGIYCCIGVVYKKKGDYDQAMDYYFKAVELFHKAHDDNHLDMASFYNNIAIIYNIQKQFAEALTFYERMLSIETDHLPADHPNLGMSYNNIGLVHYSTGDYNLAMDYFKQSLENKLKSLPTEHPLVAKSYVNMGRVYEAQKKFRQALEYFQKAAAIRHEALPSNHPDVIKIDEDIQRVSSKFM
jgi:tetratricopeptide (TPR) repeat protein